MRACTTDLCLAPARALLDRVRKRDLYAFVGECILGKCETGGRDALACQVKELVCAHAGAAIKAEDLEVMFVHIDYGMADRNPVDLVGFFKGPGAGRRIPAHSVSRLLPTVFSEQYVLALRATCGIVPRSQPMVLCRVRRYLRLFVKQRALLPAATDAWEKCRDDLATRST